MLMDNRADSGMLLSWTAKEGNEVVVRVLVENGAESKRRTISAIRRYRWQQWKGTRLSSRY
jgi:hypothetical protein